MELIEKYGGVEGSSPKGKNKIQEGDEQEAREGSEEKRSKKGRRSQGAPAQRTTMPPPPTANIQRRPEMEPTAEFAPNAEYTHDPTHGHQQHLQHPAQPHTQPLPAPPAPESHWYDRVFDVLLGEDETAPKNRIVLICGACRLVNGQAPPGAKTLADVGQWRCMACGAMNGEVKEDEGQRIVREVLGEKEAKPVETEEAEE